jgi:hypothetical protein
LPISSESATTSIQNSKSRHDALVPLVVRGFAGSICNALEEAM